MTLQKFERALKKATPKVFELAAPKGETRFVVYARSGAKSILGDDANILDMDILQLDIVTQDPADCLEKKVLDILRKNNLVYSQLGNRYDWELNLYISTYRVVI